MNKFNKSIKSIALLENDLLAIGTCDINKIEIWNITNKSKILNLNDHNDCVNALLSVKLLNKSFLISGSADSSIKLYDNNLKTIQTLREQKGSILSLDYIHQLQLITSNSSDKKIKIWSFSYKKLVEIKLAHNKTIMAICVLENGLIATGSENDATIKIWKIDKNIKVWNHRTEDTFECVATLNQESEINSLAIFGRSLLIIGHRDGTIQIRNQTSFVILKKLKGNSKNVWSIILLNNGNLASASAINSIVIWQKVNETSFYLKKTLGGHTDWVFSLVPFPNNMFASASWDKTIKIWDQTTFECIYILNDHTNYVYNLVVVRNEYLISTSFDQSIKVWDILNNFTRLTTTKTDAALYSIALFTNDSFITIQMFDMNSLEIKSVNELNQNSNETSSIIFYQNFLITGLFTGLKN